MLHKQNADRLRTRMVVEGANSPTTPGADEILRDKDILVVPDVMANAGGAVVSYFEWVQNLQHLRWEERDVNERLRRIMRKAFGEVSERADKDQVSLRTAGLRAGYRAGPGRRAYTRIHRLRPLHARRSGSGSLNKAFRPDRRISCTRVSAPKTPLRRHGGFRRVKRHGTPLSCTKRGSPGRAIPAATRSRRPVTATLGAAGP